MRRVVVLGLLVALGTVAAAAGAGQAQQQPRTIEVEQLKDNLYLLRGGGGNSLAFVRADGVTVVDTKNPGWGQPLLDAIRKLTDKPVTMIVNTHTHFDHVSGNVEFPENVEVVTHENTKANMEEMRPVTGFPAAQQPSGSIFEQNNGRGLPDRTFTDRLTVGNGADRLELYYFGRGHTDGDAWVVFPALRVMHAGDMFAGKNIPIIDANNGGSGVAYPDTLLKAHDTVTGVDAIVTGHSTVMSRADLREFSEFNREFLRAVQEGRKAGRSVDEVATSWKTPAKFTGYGDPAEARLRTNVQVIFDELQ